MVAERVEAFVSWTGTDPAEGEPITNHLGAPLSFDRSALPWIGELSTDDLAKTGVYTVLYTVIGDDALGMGKSAAIPVKRSIDVLDRSSVQPAWAGYW